MKIIYKQKSHGFQPKTLAKNLLLMVY